MSKKVANHLTDMISTRTSVYCTFQFEGFHKWPDAPDAVAFLRDRHRHMFHVRVEMTVTHDDRDIEFILLKKKAEQLVQGLLQSVETINWSCEKWARELLIALIANRVEVNEDGENGAVVERLETGSK